MIEVTVAVRSSTGCQMTCSLQLEILSWQTVTLSWLLADTQPAYSDGIKTQHQRRVNSDMHWQQNKAERVPYQ